MRTRGAASPRSASPIGPAPDPASPDRVASCHAQLPRSRARTCGRPCLWPCVDRLALVVRSAGPRGWRWLSWDGAYSDGTNLSITPSSTMTTAHSRPMAIVIRLRFRSATPAASHAARHATAEHVRQAATLALVEQDQQGQEQAGQPEQHLQGDAQWGHGLVVLWGVGAGVGLVSGWCRADVELFSILFRVIARVCART